MTEADWREVKFFKPHGPDRYGNIELLSPLVLFAADKLRALLGEPVLITSGTQGVHSRRSRHYGPHYDALDLMFPSLKQKDIPKIVELLFKIQVKGHVIGGIGAYTNWRFRPEETSLGGIHIDMRPLKSNGTRAMWIRDEDGKDWPLNNFHLNRLFGYLAHHQWKIDDAQTVGTH